MSKVNKKWVHKDEWKREGSGFAVVVSRHSIPESKHNIGEGLQRWCVYAYIYPKHKYFDSIDLDGEMYQDACNAIPLHCGCSFFKVHKDREGKVCSVQIGADYNHYHDYYYTTLETQGEAVAVFDDAESLFEWLSIKAE